MSLPTPTKPSNNGAYKLSAGGYEVTLPTTVNSGDEAIDAENYFQSIDGLDGLFPTRSPNFRGRELELTGIIQDEDTVTSLRHVLGFKRLTVERDERIVEADLVGLSIVEEVYGSLWRVSIDLEIPKYYWRSKVLIEDTGSPLSVIYEGTIPTYPIFTLAAPENGISIAHFEIDGREADFTGFIPFGETLVIDCENLTAVTESGSVTGGMNDGFFVDPPFLKPGFNIINATINGTDFFPVQVTWSDGEPVIYNGQEVYYYPSVTDFEVKYLERYL